MDNLLDDLDDQMCATDMKKTKSVSTKNLNVGAMTIPGGRDNGAQQEQLEEEEEEARITSV